MYELFNCAKVKGAKIRGARNLMGLRYFIIQYPTFTLSIDGETLKKWNLMEKICIYETRIGK